MCARHLSGKAVIRLAGIMGLMVVKEDDKGRRNSFGGNKNKNEN